MIRRLIDWYWSWRLGMKPFKPCVIYNPDVQLTTMQLEDTSIVWCPWGPYKGHAVDVGYNMKGELVGIQIWDDVRARRPKEPD